MPLGEYSEVLAWQGWRASQGVTALTRYLGTRLKLCTFFALAATVATADPRETSPHALAASTGAPSLGALSSLDPAHATDIYAHTVVDTESLTAWCSLTATSILFRPLLGFWENYVDGQVWTFYLRKGVRFHNGREVTASDFVYSFARILDPAVQSPVTDSFKYIRGVEDFRLAKHHRWRGCVLLTVTRSRYL